MSRRRWARQGRRLPGVAAVMLWASCAAASAQTPEFLYHAAPRDTLIGIGRRLLLEPRRWHELQLRNRIADPRHIPLGKILRIPYDWLKLTGESATVVSLAGDVEMAGRALTIGDLLPQGSEIHTGADGSVTLDLADGSVVTLQKSSVLRLDQMVQVTGVASARSIVLKLDTGRIETAVKPHRDVGRFEIVTPAAVSAVRGTRFRDSYTADEVHGTTETLEGTVGVGNDSAAVAVGAGFGTRVEPDHPPLAPVALLPAPDLSQVPASSGGPRLFVRWPPVAGAHEYRLQLATDSEFHALTMDRVTVEPQLDLPAPPDGEYWLRARAIDALGIEGSDAVGTVAQHLLPEAPQALSPAANAKLTGGRLHLAWAPAAATATYAIQLASDASFGSPLVDRRDLASPSTDLEPPAPGRYFWRAQAINARGEPGPWSAVQSFAQRPTPGPPEVVVERRRTAFRWQAQPGETYRFQVARDSGFARPVLDRRVDSPAGSMRTPFPGVYYCRVQSIDAEGDGGSFSAPLRFLVPIPLWVKLATPLAVGLAALL